MKFIKQLVRLVHSSSYSSSGWDTLAGSTLGGRHLETGPGNFLGVISLTCAVEASRVVIIQRCKLPPKHRQLLYFSASTTYLGGSWAAASGHLRMRSSTCSDDFLSYQNKVHILGNLFYECFSF